MNRCLHLMVVLVLVAVGMAACTETQVVRDAAPPSDGTEQNSGSGAATPEAIPITPSTLPVVTPTSGPDKTKAAPDITPPRVTSTNPKSNFKGVSPSTTINVQFSEAVAPKSVTSQTIQLTDSSGGGVEGELTCIGKDAAPSASECWSILFTPSIPLKDSEDYVLRLTPDIQDLSKNPLADSNTLEDADPDTLIRFHTSAEKTLAIAAGGSFILALKQNGEVWAWGQNSNGQLGDGTTIDRGFPVRVKGLSNVIALAAGTDSLSNKDFSMAIVKDPTTQATRVWAWGANPYGQLGDGTTTDRATPIQVQLKNSNGDAITDITAIAAGRSTAYALRSDGTVWAWGYNGYGQMGNGDLQDSHTPLQMPTLSNVKAISADAWHFMALVEDPNDPDPKTATSVWVCGYGQLGQMGNGTFGVLSYSGKAVVGAPPRYNSTPVQVKNPSGDGFLSDVAAISSTHEVLMALTTTGDVLVWGSNSYGGVGTASTRSSAGTPLQPYPVKVMSNVSKLGASGHSSFAITKTGELWGWGDNDYRQLTQSTGATVPNPTRIGTLNNVDSVRSTLFSTVILKDSGSTVMTAGLGVLGQWGTGDAFLKTHNPHLHPSLPVANQVSGRLVVGKDDGYAWAWGRNVDCEMGNATMGSEGLTPAAMAIPDTVIQVANSGVHMLALTKGGEVWAWGNNDQGQLGLGVDAVGKQHCQPVKIPGLNNIVYITAGLERYGLNNNVLVNKSFLGTSMAIRKSTGDLYSEVFAWGNNTYGQLGIGNFIDSPIPVKVNMPLDASNNPPNITQVAVTSQVLARSAEGSLYVWGSNAYGSLQNAYGYLCTGDTNRVAQTTPIRVPNISQVKQVAVGEMFSLILFDDGSVKSCGWYGYGELGTGTTTSQASPTPVMNLGEGQLAGKVDFIAAGGFMAFAITDDGRLWAWGSNRWGQLGTGDSANHAVPTPVLLPDGTPFDNVVDVSAYYSKSPSLNPVDSGVVTAIRGDGSVWDWGFLNIYPSFLMWEGEPAFRGVPQTVNWP